MAMDPAAGSVGGVTSVILWREHEGTRRVCSAMRRREQA